MAKIVGWILILLATLAGVLEWCGLRMPFIGGAFELNRQQSGGIWFIPFESYPGGKVPWVGWLCLLLIWIAGAWIVSSFSGKTKFSPLTLRRMKRFREIKRGYYSLVILLVLAFLAALDFIVVGNEALFVRYKGKSYFPAFTTVVESGNVFGLGGDDAEAPANYRDLKKNWKNSDEETGYVLLPPLCYASTLDRISVTAVELRQDGGLLYQGRRLYSGYATRVYDLESPERKYLNFRYRDGLLDGKGEGFDEEGNSVYSVVYREGVKQEGTEVYSGDETMVRFLSKDISDLYRLNYAPAPPSRDHWLGTTALGYDLLAYLYGGLQVNFQAALIYIPLIYLVGVSIGLLMGYFGGIFDLIVQRLIEILSNIPMLFVVIILAQAIGQELKDSFGLYLIVGILAFFGWMGMTYLMRTAALREKARDYVAAARVMGASTPRILIKHLFPNSIAIVVTLVPFSVSSIVMSLTALDYLGFGLPDRYASWGRLLKEGIQYLSAPWLSVSAFMVLFLLLVLVTFVGEAVREAFDPKKFSYFR